MKQQKYTKPQMRFKVSFKVNISITSARAQGFWRVHSSACRDEQVVQE